MKRQTEIQMRAELIAKIEEWVSETDIPLPYLGQSTVELMAGSVATLVLALDDTQEYLEDEGMLSHGGTGL